MQIDTRLILILITAMAAGGLIAWLICRARLSASSESLGLKNSEITELKDAVQELKEANTGLEKSLAVAEHANAAIPEIKSDLAEREMRIQELMQEA